MKKFYCIALFTVLQSFIIYDSSAQGNNCPAINMFGGLATLSASINEDDSLEDAEYIDNWWRLHIDVDTSRIAASCGHDLGCLQSTISYQYFDFSWCDNRQITGFSLTNNGTTLKIEDIIIVPPDRVQIIECFMPKNTSFEIKLEFGTPCSSSGGAKPIVYDILPPEGSLLDTCPPTILGIKSFSNCMEQKDNNNDGLPDCLINDIWDSSGNRFEVWCETKGENGYWYNFTYIPFNNGSAQAAGKCQYWGGKNIAYVFGYGSYSTNGNPIFECFKGSKWRNVDLVSDEDQDGLVDVDVYYFDTLSYENTTRHYDTLNGKIASGSLPIWINTRDPWPSFNALPPIVNPDNLLNSVMGKIAFKACDINADGDCNQLDLLALNQAMSACVGDPNYIENADYDSDGCITENDQQFIFINPDFDNDCDIDGSDLVLLISLEKFDQTFLFSQKFGGIECP